MSHSERLSTGVTYERPLARVRPHVHKEMALEQEASVAALADVWLVVAVDGANVHVPLAALEEQTWTLWAGVGTHTRVDTFVDRQGILTSKSLQAKRQYFHCRSRNVRLYLAAGLAREPLRPRVLGEVLGKTEA